MAWISENWFWLLLGVGFIAMHMFGHGGHENHGDDSDEEKSAHKSGKQRTSKQGSGHQH